MRIYNQDFIPAPHSPITIHQLYEQWGKDCKDPRIEFIIAGADIHPKNGGRPLNESFKTLYMEENEADRVISVEYDYPKKIVKYQNIELEKEGKAEFWDFYALGH